VASEDVIADSQKTADRQHGSCGDSLPIDEGPVCRAQILDDNGPVHHRGEKVKARNISAGKDDVEMSIAADGERRVAHLDPLTGPGAFDEREVKM
jgi:hypothetical protein